MNEIGEHIHNAMASGVSPEKQAKAISDKIKAKKIDRIALFQTILKNSPYELSKVKVVKEGEHLIVTEPENTDILYQARMMLDWADMIGLTAYIALREGLPVIVIF